MYGSARLWHTAVLEPSSQRVLVLGGVINDLLGDDGETAHPDEMLALTFDVGPLRLLAMEAVIRNMDRLRPGVDSLPGNLTAVSYLQTCWTGSSIGILIGVLADRTYLLYVHSYATNVRVRAYAYVRTYYIAL